MTGPDYLWYTAAALVISNLAWAIIVWWWRRRSNRVSADECGRNHELLEKRLAEGERQFESIQLTLDRVDKMVNTLAMAFIFMCEALNHAVPPDHKVSCEELIETLRKT